MATAHTREVESSNLSLANKKEIDENLSLFYLINFYKQYLHKEILLYA